MRIGRIDRIVALSVLALASSARADFVLFGEREPAHFEQPVRFGVVTPISNPFYSDNAFIQTDLRFVYNSTRWDDDEAFGGNTDLYTLQPHLALTPQIEIGLSKLGYIAYAEDDAFAGDVDNATFPHIFDDGFNDVAVTVKYGFYQNYERQLFMAVGAGYELPVGDGKAMQNDDEWRLFFAINKGQGAFHFGGNVNFIFTNGDDTSYLFPTQPPSDLEAGDSKVSIYWNLTMDYYLSKWFSPAFMLSGFHGLDRDPGKDETIGSLATAPDQFGNSIAPYDLPMADIANTATGGDIYMASFGGEFRPMPDKMPNFTIRGAFEVPFRLGNSMDTKMEYRMTFGLQYKF